MVFIDFILFKNLPHLYYNISPPLLIVSYNIAGEISCHDFSPAFLRPIICRIFSCIFRSENIRSIDKNQLNDFLLFTYLGEVLSSHSKRLYNQTL